MKKCLQCLHADEDSSRMKLSTVALVLIVIAFALIIFMLDSCERKKREEHHPHLRGADLAIGHIV